MEKRILEVRQSGDRNTFDIYDGEVLITTWAFTNIPEVYHERREVPPSLLVKLKEAGFDSTDIIAFHKNGIL